VAIETGGSAPTAPPNTRVGRGRGTGSSRPRRHPPASAVADGPLAIGPRGTAPAVRHRRANQQVRAYIGRSGGIAPHGADL